MPTLRVTFAERRAANDNFVDGDRASHRRQLAIWLEAARAILRVLTTAGFSLLLLLLLSAIVLLGLALVGVFAAGLGVFRLVHKQIPSLLPIYQVDRRAAG
ncbi:MAG TPA: hypothetical protein VH678_00440 [Xanthobacteraceae bacterium]